MLDGQAPPCRFSGEEQHRAGWAGVTMQILRSSATPWVMGRRRHANSPEQGDAVGDGQAPPCWILRSRATPRWMGRR
ncbi:Hypothetical predicted protein, partial [Cloeon dipterum]